MAAMPLFLEKKRNVMAGGTQAAIPCSGGIADPVVAQLSLLAPYCQQAVGWQRVLDVMPGPCARGNSSGRAPSQDPVAHWSAAAN